MKAARPVLRRVERSNTLDLSDRRGSQHESSALEEKQPPARERQQDLRSAARLSHRPSGVSLFCAFATRCRFCGEPFQPRRTGSGRLSRCHEVGKNSRCQIRTTRLVSATASRECRSTRLFRASRAGRVPANASGRSGDHPPLADDRVRCVQLTIRPNADALAIAQSRESAGQARHDRFHSCAGECRAIGLDAMGDRLAGSRRWSAPPRSRG